MSTLADQTRRTISESLSDSDHEITDEAIVLAIQALGGRNDLPQGVPPISVARVAGAIHEAFHNGMTIAGTLLESGLDTDALTRILDRRAEYRYGSTRNWTRSDSRSKWFSE